MNQDQRGQFSVRLIQKCPVCNNDYNEGRVEILEENEYSFLAYLTCGFCASSIIVRVMTMPHGLVGNAILTDLTAAEVAVYGAEPSVVSDQVLAIHQLIDSNGFFIEKMRKI
ncbi:MAG: hypothetical protein NTZ18_04020 [Candidatus Komeilibacteria bacterium]|nr:hypothetical protein [Candidatus Komeilibacteria bacterium]